jgi:hypothetical protein
MPWYPYPPPQEGSRTLWIVVIVVVLAVVLPIILAVILWFMVSGLIHSGPVPAPWLPIP